MKPEKLLFRKLERSSRRVTRIDQSETLILFFIQKGQYFIRKVGSFKRAFIHSTYRFHFGIKKSSVHIKQNHFETKKVTFAKSGSINQINMLDCNNRIVLRYLTEKKFRFLRHGLFLIGLLILFANANTNAQFLGNYKTYFSLALWTVFVAMFYINMYVLIPQFFFRGKYEIYTILLILLVTATGSTHLNLIKNLH